MSNAKRTVTVTVSADTSFIGNDATSADVETLARNICTEIEAQYGVSVLRVTGSSLRGFTCDDPEINEWLSQISQTDEWMRYL
jgi:hypothetical protein